jgi:hypothetical protein
MTQEEEEDQNYLLAAYEVLEAMCRAGELVQGSTDLVTTKGRRILADLYTSGWRPQRESLGRFVLAFLEMHSKDQWPPEHDGVVEKAVDHYLKTVGSIAENN